MENENLKPVQELTPFTKMIMTIGVLPTSFYSSMSYYESMVWLYEYLKNQVIPTVNNNAEAVSELQAKYIELHDYVEHYFDNLDVQEEINKKLDEMALDGSLTNLIKDYVDPIYQAYEEEINLSIEHQNDTIATAIENQNDTINNQSSSITAITENMTTLSGRVDSLSTLTEGSTTGDAELADIRTAYNGIVYNNAGNSVRGQVNQIINDVGDYEYVLTSNGYTGIIYELNESILAGTKILFKLNSYSPTPSNFFIYGYTDSSTPTTIYNKNSNVNELLGKWVTFNTVANYVKLRIYMEYGATTSTENAKLNLIIGDNDSVYMQLYKLKDIPNNVLQTKYNDSVNNSNYLTRLGTADFNNVYDFKTYYCYNLTEMSHQPISSMDGLFFTIPLRTDGNNGVLQFYCHYNNTLYYRISYGGYGDAHWNSWTKIANGNAINLMSTLNRNTYKIFKTVCCVGDSYTEGYITDSSSVPHSSNPEFSYPHYMSTASGNTYYNCGVSGANANTWLSSTKGLAKATTIGTVQAYIIGLGYNDASNDPSLNLTLGTTSDIGTENVTFYGRYSKLIRELNNISNSAIIFVKTIPKSDSRYSDYNNAIKYIANQYKDTYHVHVLDLYENIDLYSNTSLTSDATMGHLTALGYEQCAEILQYIMSSYINNNVSKFRDVAFIPYE